jgi:hypothetical protein
MPANIIVTPVSFFAVLAVVIILLLLVTRMHRPPTRPCLNCGAPVRLTAAKCRQCGYSFANYTFRR